MGPVDKPALLVPNILAGKAYGVTDLKVLDGGGDICVVLDQHSLAGGSTDDKTLMRRT